MLKSQYKVTGKIILCIAILCVFFNYFTKRDIYRAISKAQSEYMQWMHENKVDAGLFSGPVMTIDNKKQLNFTWESINLFEGQKLTSTITVPRSIFSEVEITGMGPWVDWFKEHGAH